MRQHHDEAKPNENDSLRSFLGFLYDVTSSSARTFRLLALIFIVTLLLAGVAAGLIFALEGLRTSTNASPGWASGAGVLSGIAVTVVTSLIARRSRSASRRREGVNRTERLAAERRFIESMMKLEATAAGTVSDRVGEAPDAIPLGIILRTLEDAGIWSENDVAYFRHLLRVRNSLVHDRDILDAASLQSETKGAKRLMRILEHASMRSRGGLLSEEEAN